MPSQAQEEKSRTNSELKYYDLEKHWITHMI